MGVGVLLAELGAGGAACIHQFLAKEEMFSTKGSGENFLFFCILHHLHHAVSYPLNASLRSLRRKPQEEGNAC